MRSARRRNRSRKVPIFIMSIFLIVLFIGGVFFIKDYLENNQEPGTTEPAPVENETNNNDYNQNSNSDSEPDPEQDTFTNIRIAAAGDIMFHSTQLESAYDAQNKTYDFKSVFEDVKHIFYSADLSIDNFVITSAGNLIVIY